MTTPPRPHRSRRERASLRVAAGLVASVGAADALPAWDCRPGPDGRSWVCTESAAADQGRPETAPARPRAAPPAPAPLPSPATDPAAAPVGPAAPAGPAPDLDEPVTRADDPAPGRDAAGTGPAPATRAGPVEPRAAGTAEDAGLPAAADTDAPGSPKAPPASVAPAAATGTAAPSTPPAAGRVAAGGEILDPADRPDAPDPAALAMAAAAIDDGIDWDACPTSGPVETMTFTAQPFEPGDEPIEVEADSIESTGDGQRTLLRGDVVVTQGELRLRSDRMTLDRASGEADARGNFLVVRPDMRVAGSAARYQMRDGTGEVDQAIYRIPSMRARGVAESAAFLGEGQSRYRNITLSTCRPGEDDWLLEAETLALDHAEGLGTASDATLSFMNVPFLYAPKMTFPIDDRRRSGFLIPSVGYGSRNGFDLTVPYYFNLAENYDVTFSPRLMSERGLLLGAEARLLTEDSYTELDGELLPDDRAYEGDDSVRAAVGLRHRNQFTARTRGDVRFAWVSDEDYLRDLGESLAVTSASHLEQLGQVRHVGNTWSLTGRVQNFQTIDEDIATRNRPYARLPQFLFRLRDADGVRGATYHLDAEYVRFDRDDSVTGQRVDLLPAISLPLRRTWGFLVPKAGARYTAYDLKDQTEGRDDRPTNASALASLDGGLYFDRFTTYFGRQATHTLEPRVFYLYVPRNDQNDQPVFDTTDRDLNFDNLFRENRFTGADRFGDANQMTLALTSRFLDDASGVELLRARIGQILYFQDREVTLPGQPVGVDDTSPLTAELAAQLNRGWRATAAVEWDPHATGSERWRQGLALLTYRGADRRAFNIGYRLRDEDRDRDDIEQTDIAAFWPVGQRVSLVGRYNYSLLESRLLEAIAGLEYRSCCWQVRTLLRSFTDDDDDALKYDFFVQLELNGLGRIGNDIEEVLQRSIYGYN